MRYDPESNIISIELSGSPISHARVWGNFIVHFSKNEKPVLVEILNASKFIGQFEKLKDINLNNAKTKEIAPINQDIYDC